MTALRLTAAIILGLSLTACDEQPGRAEPSSGGVGGKADDAQGAELDPAIQQEHLQAVGACESAARRDREHTSALRYVERTEIEQDRIQCITAANDGVRSALAVTLQLQAPELADDVDDAFNAWRSEHSKLCSALVEARPDALEKSISAVETGCMAEAELRLAEAVEAFADLGGGRALAPDPEARYASCFASYQAALDEPLGPDGSSEIPEVVAEAQLQHEVDAEALLADCIEGALAEEIPLLADRVIDTYPGRTPESVDDALARTFEGSAEGIAQVCIVLGYAAADGGPLGVQDCRTAAAMWRHEIMGYVVPEVAPEEPATPDE